MAYIVSNSRFKPFSYQELLAPVLAADQEYKAVQTDLGELSIKSNVWENMLDKERDKESYELFNKYNQSLQNEVNTLTSEGLSADSRAKLLGMKRAYAQEIFPIEQAYANRNEAIKQQQALRAKDSTMIFDRDMSQVSIDEMRKNPTLVPKAYSGEVLTKQSAMAASNLSKLAEDNIQWKTILGGQMYEGILRGKYTITDVINAMEGKEGADGALTLIKDSVLKSAGIDKELDPEMYERALPYVNNGLMSAINEDKRQYYQNKNWEFQQALNAGKASLENDQGINLSTHSLFEVSPERKELLSISNSIKSLDPNLIEKRADGKHYLKNNITTKQVPSNTSYVSEKGSGVPLFSKYLDNKKETITTMSNPSIKFLVENGLDPNKSIEDLQLDLLQLTNETINKYNTVSIPLDTNGKRNFLSSLGRYIKNGKVLGVEKLDGLKVTDKSLSASDLEEAIKSPDPTIIDYSGEHFDGYIMKIGKDSYRVKPNLFSNELPQELNIIKSDINYYEKFLQNPRITQEQREEAIRALNKSKKNIIIKTNNAQAELKNEPISTKPGK